MVFFQFMYKKNKYLKNYFIYVYIYMNYLNNQTLMFCYPVKNTEGFENTAPPTVYTNKITYWPNVGVVYNFALANPYNASQGPQGKQNPNYLSINGTPSTTVGNQVSLIKNTSIPAIPSNVINNITNYYLIQLDPANTLKDTISSPITSITISPTNDRYIITVRDIVLRYSKTIDFEYWIGSSIQSSIDPPNSGLNLNPPAPTTSPTPTTVPFRFDSFQVVPNPETSYDNFGKGVYLQNPNQLTLNHVVMYNGKIISGNGIPQGTIIVSAPQLLNSQIRASFKNCIYLTLSNPINTDPSKGSVVDGNVKIGPY